MRKAALVILGSIAILACPNREKAPSDTAATTATTSTTYTDTTATTSTASPAAEYKLDHYKFWKVKAAKPMTPIKVSLKGQFDQAPWPAELVSIEYLGNPAEKTVEGAPHTPIQNEKLHLVAYAMKSEKQPERTVRVMNQFAPNGEEWRLDSPAWLLTPADKQMKGDTQPPPRGDHYVCYAVIEGKPVPRAITLLDQFDRQSGGPEHLETLTPKYFCVPVEKTFQKPEPEPIYDKDTHLAIYEIKPPRSSKIVVQTQDQFGRQELRIRSSQFLGVPSRKQWQPTK